MKRDSSSLGRRVVKTLAWSAVLIAGAGAANIVGIAMVGSVDGWQRWLHDRAPYFFAWRLMLYSVLGYGWLRLRRRQFSGAQHGPARRQLLRAETAAVLALAALEISVFVG